MASWGQAGILLLVITLLGIIGKNYVVAAAAGALLVLRLLHGETLLPFLGKNAINVGIGIITLAILVPFASGEIGWKEMYRTLASPIGLVTLAAGIFVAYLGGRGVSYLTAQPQVMVGLMVGTILGVAFFRGIPVGPLIAAGMVSLLMGLSGYGK